MFWWVSKEHGVEFAVWAHEYDTSADAHKDATARNSVVQGGPFKDLLALYHSFNPGLVSFIRPAITGGSSGGGKSGQGGNRADLVQEALNSIGHAYTFGGAPGPNGDQPWDCSSCQNDNIGRVNGLSIPGYPDGSYDGTVHGPSTIGWLDAQGGIVGSIDRSLAEGGDLAVWRTHMGMFINSDEMVSAANPSAGTIRSGVDGFIQGEQLVVLRLAHFGPGGITLPVPTIGSDAHLEQLTRQIAESDRSLVARRMQIARIGRGRF